MITEYKISDNDVDICIEVIRSGRKSIGLEVKADGRVFARIPRRISDRELKKFLNEHKAWIFQKTRLVEDRQKNQKTTGAVPLKELDRKETQKIKERFMERVQYYSSLMGVIYGRVTIRSQKTRWGSCSAKGNLNFNYQLYYLPPELLDYVVVHELAHRKYMDHSAAFWEEVGKYFPDYKECRKRLKEVILAKG